MSFAFWVEDPMLAASGKDRAILLREKNKFSSMLAAQATPHPQVIPLDSLVPGDMQYGP
jgi:hypothetical protein